MGDDLAGGAIIAEGDDVGIAIFSRVLDFAIILSFELKLDLIAIFLSMLSSTIYYLLISPLMALIYSAKLSFISSR